MAPEADPAAVGSTEPACKPSGFDPTSPVLTLPQLSIYPPSEPFGASLLRRRNQPGIAHRQMCWRVVPQNCEIDQC